MEMALVQADPLKFERVCRSRGLALTIQRRAVFDELSLRRDHPTVDQVWEALRSRFPTLSRTTVYRVLDVMVEAGLARRVDHPGAVARFDPITRRHHHLICEACGALFDLADDALPKLKISRLGSSQRFAVRDYTVNITGLCAECQ